MQKQEKKSLEEFMRTNRDEFDIDEVPAGTWEKIISKQEILAKTEEKPKAKIIQFPSWLGKVAAAIIISLSSIFIYEQVKKQNTHQEISNGMLINEDFVAFQEAEQFYQSKVEEQLHKIETVADESMQKDIEYDLAELDSAYADLKNDLKDNIANEEIIEAMIQNYRLKLDILENVLEELEKTTPKNEKNETIEL